MLVLNTQFMDKCPLLASDFLALANMFCFKQKHGAEFGNYLTVHRASNQMSGRPTKRGTASPMKGTSPQKVSHSPDRRQSRYDLESQGSHMRIGSSLRSERGDAAPTDNLKIKN